MRLRHRGRAISSLDLFDTRLVLLTGPGPLWADAARRVASELGAPVVVHRIGTEIDDPDGRWLAAYGVGTDGATLVRPDGFVAWRCPDEVEDPVDELADAVRAVLGDRRPVAP
ncbi:MAG: hypothetical protein L0K86_03600 [Actinomycetia bacterium]|nr:hypothetical protein [Actinomycetes bacterium]